MKVLFFSNPKIILKNKINIYNLKKQIVFLQPKIKKNEKNFCRKNT